MNEWHISVRGPGDPAAIEFARSLVAATAGDFDAQELAIGQVMRDALDGLEPTARVDLLGSAAFNLATTVRVLASMLAREEMPEDVDNDTLLRELPERARVVLEDLYESIDETTRDREDE